MPHPPPPARARVAEELRVLTLPGREVWPEYEKAVALARGFKERRLRSR